MDWMDGKGMGNGEGGGRQAIVALTSSKMFVIILLVGASEARQVQK